MWSSQQPMAIKIGLTLKEYWGHITPKIVKIYADAYQEKVSDQINMLDATNHILGSYIRIAIGDALSGKSNYPEQPQTAKRRSTLKLFTKEETDEFIRKRQAKND